MWDRVMINDLATSSYPQFKVPLKLSASSFDWHSEGIDKILFWDTVHVPRTKFAQEVESIKCIKHYSQLFNIRYLNLHTFLGRNVFNVYFHNIFTFLIHLSKGCLSSFFDCCLILFFGLFFFLNSAFYPCLWKSGHKFMETDIGINWKPIRQLKVFIRIIGVDLSHSDFSQSVVYVYVIVDLLERDLNKLPFRFISYKAATLLSFNLL